MIFSNVKAGDSKSRLTSVPLIARLRGRV